LKTHYLDSGIGRMVQIEGKDYLYFSGTSYLGIAQDTEFLDNLANNFFEFGAHHGQSRIGNVRLHIFDDFEESFALSAGADAAALFSSGYLAGIAAWKSVIDTTDEVWIAPGTHAAVIPDHLRPAVDLNFAQWKTHCLEQSEQLSARRILIIGNALDPLACEIHDYGWIREIASKHKVSQLVDDSHAFATYGNSIYGSYQRWANPQVNLVVSGSLGKGLGLPAGIVLGRDSQIDKIKATALFGGASPGSPAFLRTFLEMEDRYLEKKRWLTEACGFFAQENAKIRQINGSRYFPAFIYTEDAWVKEFEKAGIITSSFSYPTADSPSVNRIIISGFHEMEDLMYLNDIIHNLARS
jgi:8-amino-7-oxononanoate synthase